MRTPNATQSLETFFRRNALRWAAFGLLLTLSVGVPSALYLEKSNSERQIQAMATAAATAYRGQIIDSNYRLAQAGIREAFSLRSDESAVILRPDFSPAYTMDEKVPRPFCLTSNVVCWSSGFGFMSILHPIYFDADQKGDVANYLLIVRKASVDAKLLGILFGSLVLGFLLQGIGLFGALRGTMKVFRAHLANWSDYLKRSPSKKYDDEKTNPPFEELVPMQNAVMGLHDEIQALQKVAVAEAKASTQLMMLQEIGHDLRTPLSQLAKYFAALSHVVRHGRQPKEELLSDIEGSIQKMGNIVRQTRDLYSGSGLSQEACAIVAETRKMIRDISQDSELIQKSVRLGLDADSVEQVAQVSPVAFHRITENLIRNAVHAVGTNGKVQVAVSNQNGKPVLSVRDNGSGIAPEIREKIFDFYFTTKPARGTGIGLGIVKRICGEINAEIDFKSEVGAGTEFTVVFQPATQMESSS